MSRSNKEDVYAILQEKIIKQELEPGASLHEKELMSLYGIGRTPLRDIIMKLKLENLVETVPQSGTFVKKLDLNELRDAIEMRVPLELLAAKVIPFRITDIELDEIRFILSVLEKKIDTISPYEIKIYTDKLHDIYYGATRNKKLSQTLTELHNFSSRAWYTVDFKKDYIKNSIKDWKMIEELITNKDIDKLQGMMEEHIVGFAKTLKLNLEY